MDLEVLAADRRAARIAAGRRLAGHAVEDGRGQVDAGEGIAEFPGTGRGEFVHAFVVVDRVVPSVSPALHGIEDGGEQGLLVLPHRRGAERPAILVLDEALPFRGLPEELLGAATDFGEVLEVGFLDELPELLEIHDHRLRVPQGFLELFEQAVDRLEFLADLEGLLDGGYATAAEGPAVTEAFDPVLVRHRLHDAGDLAAGGRVPVEQVPQSLESVDLAFADLPGQPASNGVVEPLVGEDRAGEVVDDPSGVGGGRRRVPGREDLVLA